MSAATVVVGAGPAGILAAILSAQKGNKVYLIEEEAECGGLLRSFTNPEGVVFDYGSHFLRQTGIAELDTLLFGEFDKRPSEWQRMPYLKNGTYFAGKLYEKSCFVNATALPPSIYDKGILELLHASPPLAETCTSDAEYLSKTFGPTFVEHIFQPALHKFYGTDLANLAPKSHVFFDLSRVIALTPEISRQIKKSPLFDSRLAYHFSDEGQAGLMNYYPTTGGMGLWIQILLEKAAKLGVTVLNSTRVTKVNHELGYISGVELSTGQRLSCEKLVWSVVPFPLLKAAGVNFELERVQLRTSNIYFYEFDKPLQTECTYFACLDPQYKTFRVSSYANFRSSPKDKQIHAVCVEVIDSGPNTTPEAVASIANELKAMGVLEQDAKVKYSHAIAARAGFPVFTNGFVKQLQGLRSFLGDSFSNLLLTGKGSGKTFFTGDTLADTYRTMKEKG